MRDVRELTCLQDLGKEQIEVDNLVSKRVGPLEQNLESFGIKL